MQVVAFRRRQVLPSVGARMAASLAGKVTGPAGRSTRLASFVSSCPPSGATSSPSCSSAPLTRRAFGRGV